EKESLGTHVLLGQILAVFFMREQMFKLPRDAGQFEHRISRLLGRNGAPNLSEIESEQIQSGQLCGESFARGNTDFWSRMGVNRAGSLAGNHRTNHVADGQSLRALRLGLA